MQFFFVALLHHGSNHSSSLQGATNTQIHLSLEGHEFKQEEKDYYIFSIKENSTTQFEKQKVNTKDDLSLNTWLIRF